MKESVHKFRELNHIYSIEKRVGRLGEVHDLAQVDCREHQFPVKAFSFGSKDPQSPALAVIGGVHGIEKVGTHICLYFLRSFLQQMKWDKLFRQRIESMRVVFIPLVNPGGMFLNYRSNPQGVDLMRNAPVDSEEKVAFLVGGHRRGPWLPWYRGVQDTPMQVESQALVDYVQNELFGAEILQTIDLHSGFGRIDRLWYPYAKTRGLFPERDNIRRLSRLLRRTYPYNVYRVERQSKTYTTHGDLWDYMFDNHFAKYQKQKTFLPWTLELGSWAWVKKNPRQLFHALGGFNPILPHRYKRIMRRHGNLLEFLIRSTSEHESWVHRP